MASRNIASMHMFLEMKQKFPDLSEDILRNYALLYSEDKSKCASLLQKESQSHLHSQPFSEIRLPSNKSKPQTVTTKISTNQDFEPSNSSSIYLQSNCNNPLSAVKQQTSALNFSGRSISHTNIIQMPLNSDNSEVPFKSEVKSAPVPSMQEKPFSNMFKEGPFSSHTTVFQIPTDIKENRMMFSTTKEHIIESSEQDREWPDVEDSQKHSVSLSMTPSFPFPQQQMSVYSSVSSIGSSISKPGKHTTSLNLQLQPQALDSPPVEISTIPTNIGSPSDFRDFSSHLQISVGTQGATFTAVRLQRPQSGSNHRPVSDQQTFTFSQSSRSQNYKELEFPSTPTQEICDSSIRELDLLSMANRDPVNDSGPQQTDEVPCSSFQLPGGGLDAPTNFCHGFQASPDYIKAVKKHQQARLELVKEELEREKSSSSKLKSEVEKLEQEIVKRREKRNSFSYAELLQKLKEENRKLRLECNCLLMEYDVSSKGQIPVGVTDEDFYSNIFTGPNDGLSFYTNEGRRKKSKGNSVIGQKPNEEDEEENNRWKCKNCTFANHPALEKCEMCELPKNLGNVTSNSNFYTSSHLKLEPQSRRAVGCVQISVTRKVPIKTKSVKLQLTHRIPR